MNSKDKTAFINFFPVFPVNTGSAEVSFSFFKCWPAKNKKLFQISHHKNIKNNKMIRTIKILKEGPINKLLCLPKMIYELKKYLMFAKRKTIIIEGPSWIGYTFIVSKLIKIIYPDVKFIYRSHSIEYEIRKTNSNFLIAYLTKLLEKNIFNSNDYCTSVSKFEAKKIKKFYGVRPYIFPNAVSLSRLKITKKNSINNKIPKQFILFSGSYMYKPNRIAIDLLIHKIMPLLIKDLPNLKLVLTGGGTTNQNKWLINLGVISKEKLIYFISKSNCIVVPIYEGYGTRIKIIEALMLGKIVISTKKGIEGIDYNKNQQPPFVDDNLKNFIKNIKKVINKKNYSKKSFIDKKKYQKLYSMEKLAKKFYKNIK